MTASAQAKINLGLHVLRRRPDGYHDIETVLYPIGWADRIEVQPSAGMALECSDPTIPCDETNLCLKAASLLSRYAGIDAGARISLVKNVPHGAGLGGGSSDAAVTLRLLDRLWKTGIEERVLNKLASQLGSDVPFFLNPFAAHVSGRGDVLEPLPAGDGGFRLPAHLIVAAPPIRISTAEAYAMVTPREAPPGQLKELVLSLDFDRWRAELVNDFEAPVFERYPEIGLIKARLYEMGARYASMSGSGSAVFGVFERADDAERIAGDLQKAGYRVWSDVDEGHV